jgi:mRNA interferase RelE/StbE
MWTIDIDVGVKKDMKAMSPRDRQRIFDFLENRLATLENPRSLGKALTGPFRSLWRYRVGDYRIICRIKDQSLTVVVIAVGHRRDVYRDEG